MILCGKEKRKGTVPTVKWESMVFQRGGSGAAALLSSSGLFFAVQESAFRPLTADAAAASYSFYHPLCLQAMINEGLIDPVNGFDDFRIVIGDGDGGK